MIAETLKTDLNNIDQDSPVITLGLSSMILVDISDRINARFEINLTPTHFFEYETLRGLNWFLTNEYQDVFQQYYRSMPTVEQPNLKQAKNETEDIPKKPLWEKNIRTSDATRINEAIAVIGQSAIFPQSKDLDTFVKHLENQEDLIMEIPGDRWVGKVFSDHPDIKWGGFIDDIDRFDAGLFKVSLKEAEEQSNCWP